MIHTGLPCPQNAIGAAFGFMLLAYAERKHGLTDIERAIELANDQFLRSQVTQLRGPAASEEFKQTLEAASVFLANIAAIARVQAGHEGSKSKRKRDIKRSPLRNAG
jgi:hypothetical protein